MYKLLLVEDDYSYAEALIFFLEQNNFDVTHYDNGSDALSIISQNNFHLIILDISLPDIDGYEILNKIKNNLKDTKIIFASARDDIEFKVKAFEMGAHDFLPKPFNPVELLHRINARLNLVQNNQTNDESVLIFDETKDIITFGKKILNLTPNEKKLLSYLIVNKQQIISKELLYELLNANPSNRTIDLLISSIRKKIEIDPQNPQYLKSLYGQGILLDI